MKPTYVFSGIAGFVAGMGLVRSRSRAKNSGLAVLDQRFHAAYDRLRDDASKSVPVLVFFQGTLHLLHGTVGKEYVASDPSTQLMMAAAHDPVGIFALLLDHATADGKRVSEPLRQRLFELRRAQQHARASVEQLGASARSLVTTVLDASERYISEILSRGVVTHASLAQFATDLGPVLLELIEEATRLELAALDRATALVLQHLTREQQKQLEVIVAGVHQARARSLPLQYFQQRLGEAPGEEHRLAYAESATDPLQARLLVGTRRLDKIIAEAFFGDAKRLQRDLLGDAAARLLQNTELEPIG
jgi:hypothetical protein